MNIIKKGVALGGAAALSVTGANAEGLQNDPLTFDQARKHLIQQVRGDSADILTPEQLSGLTAIDMDKLKKELGFDKVQDFLEKSFDENGDGKLSIPEANYLENTFPQGNFLPSDAAMHTDTNDLIFDNDAQIDEWEKLSEQISSSRAAYNIIRNKLDINLFHQYHEILGGGNEMAEFASELLKGRDEYIEAKKNGKRLTRAREMGKSEERIQKSAVRSWNNFLDQLLAGKACGDYKTIGFDAPGLVSYMANEGELITENIPEMSKVVKLLIAIDTLLNNQALLTKAKSEFEKAKINLADKESNLIAKEELLADKESNLIAKEELLALKEKVNAKFENLFGKS